MPEIRISVGERSYTVACNPGEEVHLQAAAGMLDTEAKAVLKAAPKVTETQLLLMAGLMLADRLTSDGQEGAYTQHQLGELEAKLAASQKEAAELGRALQTARAEAVPNADGGEAELLEKMAVELERLADEMEAACA